MLTLAPKVFATIGRWSFRANGVLPLHEVELVHDVVEDVDML